MLISQNSILQPNKVLRLSLLMSSLLFTACNSDNKQNKKTTDQDLSGDNAFSEFEGHWDRKGYGELWVIDDTNLNIYNYNSFGCVQKDQTKLGLYHFG